MNKYVYAALAFFLGVAGHTDFIENNMVKHYYIYLFFVGQVFLVLLRNDRGVIAFIKTADVQGNI